MLHSPASVPLFFSLFTMHSESMSLLFMRDSAVVKPAFDTYEVRDWPWQMVFIAIGQVQTSIAASRVPTLD